VDRPDLRRIDPENLPSNGSAESAASKDWGDDWVHELIAMTRPGIEINIPARMPWERQVPFEYDDFS
jgi:hypothetical protein